MALESEPRMCNYINHVLELCRRPSSVSNMLTAEGRGFCVLINNSVESEMVGVWSLIKLSGFGLKLGRGGRLCLQRESHMLQLVEISIPDTNVLIIAYLNAG